MTAPPIPDDALPVRRPHFHLRGTALFFLISRRPLAQLGDEEVRVWQALDGVTTMPALRARLGESADRCIGRFEASGLCELLLSGFAPNRRRIVVVEPHMDDAILSVGGTMWARRHECEFVVVTIAGRSNFTSYYDLDRDFFDVDQISALRQAESELALRLLGARHVALEELEAPLRYRNGNWTLDWFRRHRRPIVTFLHHHSGPSELRAWTEALDGALSRIEFDEVWLPLGVGMHTDHELTRDAGLAVLARNRLLAGRCPVRLYQEVPYAARYPDHAPAIVRALTAAGARLEREEFAIDEAMPQKLRLAAIFGSQFKLSTLQASIEACARGGEGESGGLRETFYSLLAAPRPDEARHAGRAVGAGSDEGLHRWLRRHRQTRLLRVLAPVGAGRWAEDVQCLLDTFPEARLEVHVDRAYAAESEGFASSRVAVRPVDGRYLGWGLRIAHVAAGRGPLLVLPGWGRERYGRIIRALSFVGDPLVVPTMSDFVLRLQRAGYLPNARRDH